MINTIKDNTVPLNDDSFYTSSNDKTAAVAEAEPKSPVEADPTVEQTSKPNTSEAPPARAQEDSLLAKARFNNLLPAQGEAKQPAKAEKLPSQTPTFTAATGDQLINVNGRQLTANDAYQYYKTLIDERSLIDQKGSSFSDKPGEINIVAIRDYVNGAIPKDVNEQKSPDVRTVYSEDGKQRISAITPENSGKINSTIVAIYVDKNNQRHVEYFPANFDARKGVTGGQSASRPTHKEGYGHVGEGTYQFQFGSHGGKVIPSTVKTTSPGRYEALIPADKNNLTIIRDVYEKNHEGIPFKIDPSEINKRDVSTDQSFHIHYGGENLVSTAFSSGCLVIPKQEVYGHFIDLTKGDGDKKYNVTLVDSSRLADYELNLQAAESAMPIL